jgi:hypothetical protein
MKHKSIYKKYPESWKQKNIRRKEIKQLVLVLIAIVVIEQAVLFISHELAILFR